MKISSKPFFFKFFGLILLLGCLNYNLSSGQSLQPMQNRLNSLPVCFGDTLVVDVRSTNTPSMDSLALGVLIDTNLFSWVGFTQVHPFINSASIQAGPGNPYLLSFHSNSNDTVGFGSHTWFKILLLPKLAGIATLHWDTAGSVILDSIGQPYEAVIWIDGNPLIYPILRNVIPRFICDGDSSFFGGNNYFVSGIYRDTLQSSFGCDSINEMHLTVLSDSVVNASQGICYNGTINWGGLSITQPGLYVDTLLNSAGCDSIIHLMVYLLPNSTYNLFDTICSGQLYIFQGDTLINPGIYPFTISAYNGCDSTIVLDLTVLPVLVTNLDSSICQGEPFFFGGQTVSSSVPGQQLLSDTLVSIYGCDSVLNLRLRILPRTTDTLRISRCFGDLYYFNNTYLSVGGIYIDTLINHLGCDSLSVLVLNIRPQQLVALFDTICSGVFYSFGNQIVSLTGTYRDTLQSSFGCDSIIELHMLVLSNSISHSMQGLCPNGSIVWGGIIITQPGVFVDTLTNSSGCDSIINLTVFLLPSSNSNIFDTVCSDSPYIFLGDTLLTQGVFTFVISASNGCDSTVLLHLAHLPIVRSFLDTIICQGSTYLFGSQLISSSLAGMQILTDTFVSAVGCDSIVNMRLRILPRTSDTSRISICFGDTYMFNNLSLSIGGTYLDTLVNHFGCDSIRVLYLTIRPQLQNHFIDTICPGQLVSFGNQILSLPGTYQDTLNASIGCDSVLTLVLVEGLRDSVTTSDTICQGTPYVFNGQSLSTSGNYTAVYTNRWGCDSVIRLALVVNQSYTVLDFDTLCMGDTLFFGGVSITSNGVYSDSLRSLSGCDSIVTKNVWFRPMPVIQRNVTLCAGDTLWIGGMPYFSNGVILDTIQNLNCDSLVRYQITTLPYLSRTVNITLCQGQSYLWDNLLLNQAGVFYDTVLVSNGCDSIITLNLGYIVPTLVQTNQWLCQGDSLFFASVYLSTSGIYRDTIRSINGCDSVWLRLQLNVHSPLRDTLQDSVCFNEPYIFGTDTLRFSGVYTDTIPGLSGCDSIHTLFLYVRPSVDTTINVFYPFGTYYPVGNYVFNTTGRFVVRLPLPNGCDSIVILNLIIQPPISGGTGGGGTGIGGPGNWGPGCGYFPYTTVIEDVYGCVGDTVEVPIWLYNAADIASFSHTIDLDSSKVRFIGINSILSTLNSGTLTYNAAMFSTTTGSRYQFRLNWVDTNAYSFGSAVLYKIRLLITDSSRSSLIWDLQNVGLCQYGTITGNPVSNPAWYNGLSHGGVRLFRKDVSLCYGQVFQFYGTTISSSGVYVHQVSGIGSGCDSLIYLNLWINDSIGRQINWEICSGDRVTFNGNFVHAPGVYNYIGFSYMGCDSIVSMTLNVRQNSANTIYDTIPYGTLYQVGPFFFDKPGTYTTILRAANGCDSVLTIHLVFSSNGRIVTSIGGNYGMVGDTIIVPLIIKNRIPFSGFAYHIDYDSSLLHFVGMDSVFSLFSGSLNCIDTVYAGPLGIRKKIILDGLSANYLLSNTIRVAQLKFRIMRPGAAILSWMIDSIYRSRYMSLSGTQLDSTVWVNGWIYGGVYHGIVQDTICQGNNYQFGIQVLDSAGVYLSRQLSSLLADSLVTLNLFVIDNPDTLLISLNSQRDSLILNGIYSSVSWYRDSIIQPFYGNSMPVSGIGTHSYFAIGQSPDCGDDTSVVLVWPSVSVNSLTSNGNWVLYPNPNSGRMNLRKLNSSCLGNIGISLLDQTGKKVLQKTLPNLYDNCDFEFLADGLKPAVYILKIVEENQSISYFKIIIQ